METLAERYGPWALLAGGSEGIGLAFARELAAAGVHLILLARNEERLSAAAETLRGESSVQVQTRAVDLTSPSLEKEAAELSSRYEIGLLIYNAGAVHGADLFLDRPLAQARQLVDLNCHGPIVLCHTLGRGMRQRGRGGIVLLSSMSGLGGSAYTATYSATKSFDIVLAEALWAELSPCGVHVLGLICGATDTPAMERSGVEFGGQTGIVPMAPEEVAREGLAALAEGPLHVAGDGNRAIAPLLRGPREQAIELLSMGAASLYDKPWPPEATPGESHSPVGSNKSDS